MIVNVVKIVKGRAIDSWCEVAPPNEFDVALQYGYPVCCIATFYEQLRTDMSFEARVAAKWRERGFGGFIACSTCAKSLIHLTPMQLCAFINSKRHLRLPPFSLAENRGQQWKSEWKMWHDAYSTCWGFQPRGLRTRRGNN